MNTLRCQVPFALLLATLVGSLVVVLQVPATPGLYWNAATRIDLLGWSATVLLTTALVRQVAGPSANRWLLTLLLAYLAVGAGLVSSASVLGYAMSCLAAGSLTLRLLQPEGPAAGLIGSLLLGTAVTLAVFGLLLHFPVNTRGLQASLLGAAPLFWLLLPGWQRCLQQWLADLGAAGRVLDRWSPGEFVLLLGIGGFVARHAFLPTLMYDDNSLHLRLWTELGFYRQALFAVEGQVWSVAPFAVDLQHAIVSLLAGEDARAALDLFWLGLLLAGSWQLAQHLLPQQRGVQTVLLLLLLTTPMLSQLLIGLQTELFLAVLSLAGLQLLLQPKRGALLAQAPALLAVAALCCATKLPGAVLGLLLLAAATLQFHLLPAQEGLWRRPPPLRLLLGSGLLALLGLVALHAYAYAWYRTGNPLFPLYNSLFKSALFDSSQDFSDARWQHGFSLGTFWRVFHGTSAFHEGRNFVAGFQYLWLLPAAVVGWLLNPGKTRWLPLLLPCLGFGVIMFAATQYWRYQFPVLPLAGLATLLLVPLASSLWQRVTLWAALLLAVVLNLLFLPGVAWPLSLAPGQALNSRARDELLAAYTPAAALNAHLNRTAPGSRVVYPGSAPFGATLQGEPLYLAWIAPGFAAKAAAVGSEQDLRALLDQERIDYVIRDLDEPLTAGVGLWVLQDYLSRHAEPELQAGNHVLYRLTRGEVDYTPHYSRSETQRLAAGPQRMATLAVERAGAARLRLVFRCRQQGAELDVLLAWDRGRPFFQRLPCPERSSDYRVSMPVPPGAREATLQLTGSAGSEPEVGVIRVELN